MKILICPDSFKGTFSAIEAAKLIASVFKADKTVECQLIPLADGGEGSLDCIQQQIKRSIKISVEATNVLGQHQTGYYLRDKLTAYIEIANVGSMQGIKAEEKNPLIANTYGTGQLIAHALTNHCTSVVLFLGGSATVDGGCGLMQAMCNEPFPSNNPLLSQELIDIQAFKDRIKNLNIHLVCDVRNTATGAQGAAQVFGPQKGANPQEVMQLEKAMNQWLQILQPHSTKALLSNAHLGAAGGVGLPFVALNCNTLVSNGFDYFNQLFNYEKAIQWADAVITGEGCIDEQTSMGKGPGRIAGMAKEAGKQVIGIGGLVKVQPPCFDSVFSTTKATNNEAPPLNQAKSNLLQTSKRIRAFLLS